MFWAVFVLGYDCGHGSFSDSVWQNNLVRHFLHSLVLVPYHGWRISHRKHHNNHGHVENDESWTPLPEKLYRSLDYLTRKMRFTLPFPVFAYPIYLWRRSPGKYGSYYNPNSDLFQPHEKWDVITFAICWAEAFALILLSALVYGPSIVLKLYGVPYVIFVVWLDLVTYLHHHGHEDKLPWYSGDVLLIQENIDKDKFYGLFVLKDSPLNFFPQGQYLNSSSTTSILLKSCDSK